MAASPGSRDGNMTLVGLRVLTLGVGLFFLFMSLNKLAWLANPDLLADRFTRWLPTAAPYARMYLQTVAIPGAEVFARVVPIGEFLTAIAMHAGNRTNIVAAAALFMIINFHLATSSFSSVAFLRDGTGPPLFAALLALALTPRRLPASVGVRR
jgi:hypothetical protein